MNLLEHWCSRHQILTELVRESGKVSGQTTPARWLTAEVECLVHTAHQELVLRRFDIDAYVSPSKPSEGRLSLYRGGWGHRNGASYGWSGARRCCAFSPQKMTLVVFRKRKRVIRECLRKVETGSSSKARAVFEVVSKVLSRDYWPALYKINHLTDHSRDKTTIDRDIKATWADVGRWTHRTASGVHILKVSSLRMTTNGFGVDIDGGASTYELQFKPYDLVVLDAMYDSARALVDRVRAQRNIAQDIAQQALKKIKHGFTWVTMAEEL